MEARRPLPRSSRADRAHQTPGDCNYLHKGDVRSPTLQHRYGLRQSEVFRYWLDTSANWSPSARFLARALEFFNLQGAPGLPGRAKHVAGVQVCERETLRLAKLFNTGLKDLYVDAFDGDPAYIAFVEARGFQREKHGITLTRHNLEDLPAAELPPGYRIHEASAADMDQLTDLHNHTFADK